MLVYKIRGLLNYSTYRGRSVSVIMTRVLALALVACCGAFAQGVALSLASGSGSPGAAVTLNLSLNATGGNQPAALQWTLTYSSTDFSFINVAAGPVATAAGKSLSCNNAVGSSTCVVWGLNSTAIANGVVAAVTLTLSGSTSNVSSSIQLLNGVAAAPDGTAISTSTAGGTVTILQGPSLTGISCNPASVLPPAASSCTVTLSSAAPSGGIAVNLRSNSANAAVPASLTIPALATSAGFNVTTTTVAVNTTAQITASMGAASVSSAVSLLAPSISISVTPTPAIIKASQAVQLTATVTGPANTGVNWSITPAQGSISSSGLYTAPAWSIPSGGPAFGFFAQMVVVTATSQADPTKSSIAVVMITPNVGP
jgi:cohesin domain-containing protein